MRFKLRFLKRLEVKLVHLVCLLLSNTRQNRTDGKKRNLESFFFFIILTQSLFY